MIREVGGGLRQAIPPEDEPKLLDAAISKDGNEYDTVILVARSATGATTEELLGMMRGALA